MRERQNRLFYMFLFCALLCALLLLPFSPVYGQNEQASPSPTQSTAIPADISMAELVNTVYYGQTGNPFTDAINGNIPFTDGNRGDAWSFFGLLISIISILLGTGIIVGTLLLPKKRISGASNRKAFRNLRMAASVFSFFPFILFAVRSDLQLPIVWFTHDTMWICLLFTLAFCTYILSHIPGNEDKKL